MKKFLPILFVIMSCQPASKVLMTIDNRDISSDEFERIYNKNSAITLEEKKSVEDYLDLFINYKLKVIEAENLGYDTIPSFVKEMDGYTKQLAKPYIEKNTSMDSLVKVVYDRYTQEVNASHILLQLGANALPRDTARVYNRIMAIRDSIMAKANPDGSVSKEVWNEEIDKNSKDPQNKIGGDLGWFGAFRMLYTFEEAAYNTPVHHVSMPIRTMYGYHLIYVNDKRPNRGEVNARHIMTIIPRDNPTQLELQAARNKIEKARAALENGADWDSICREYSEHKSTYFMGGKLGWIKAGNAPEELLDVCFNLEPGEISDVFRSQYGYHIAMIDEKKPIESFDEAKDEFTKKLSQMNEIAKYTIDERQNRIKKEFGFVWNEDKMDQLYDLIDTTAYNGTWDASVAKNATDVLFSIGDSTYTVYDAAKKIAERRLSYRGIPLKSAIRSRILAFVDEKVLDYELQQLPLKYPEYANLLQEYHDGILLFNLTEDKVWKKAVEDSAGLVAFYDSLPEKYQWQERIQVTKYTYSDEALQDKILEVAKNHASEGTDVKQLVDQICPEGDKGCVSISEFKYEKGDNAIADELTWEKGKYELSTDKDNYVLYYVDDVLPPAQKTLEDARGLYTADYQTYLEDKWVKSLREKYPVVINKKVLKKVIREESKK